MKLIVDHADLDQIKEMFEYFPVSGVTTNPTIITRTGKDPYEVLKSIREFIGADAELHAQVISSDAEGMMAEAKVMRETVGGNFYVKIPTTKEGLKAIKNLKKEGFKVTATAVYTSIQAYLAAEAGADYVAPYLNRIDNLGYDGIQTACDIHDIFENNGYQTKVLAASFKNTQQVLELAKYGVGAATVAPDVIRNFVNNVAVDSAVDAFVKDFNATYGDGKTMLK
ncbi:transaldolase [Mediterraneibacter butyricigenes]|jgi:TalC/MipB family fructose-6-phosphate aldolase|uniref:Transaldolase n=1 Tax=Mediterraneibacter butyricigenes TaxID=2316025 RepID=A0A391P2U1_9FIRM|nr:fructose-6-phosphate aldolase [Mediterraneibacter butyricigenes]RGO19390.1 fructose-6-phosphate aldolase [Dorea sp. OM02-2LB]RGV92663.1 fructose-6-phosphate aldolase [Ruminococcus sp. AF14-10]GCA67717.1 transaldolase [Mediterraneibacter butyricigenes]